MKLDRVRDLPWVAVALAFVVLSPVASILTKDASGRASVTWIVVQAVATGLAFAIPQFRQLRAEQREAEAKGREFDARVAIELAFNDALEPIVRLLGELALQTRKAPREQLRAQAVPLVLATAAQLIGPGRSRACWFALETGPPERLVPEEALGRAGAVTTTFEQGTPAGDAALDLVTTDAQLLVPDATVEPGPAWVLDPSPDYGCLMAVAVTAGNVAYGMITLDALEPGSLTDSDLQLLRLMAGALAVALSIN